MSLLLIKKSEITFLTLSKQTTQKCYKAHYLFYLKITITVFNK
jgi:hypothetical protein